LPKDEAMPSELDVRRRRAAFRANHRGTKEMDWLLGRYADTALGAMTDTDLDVFEQLIQVPDPDLHAWILDPASNAESAFADLIGAVRTFHKLDQPVG
jgi:antitoxin CptB